MYLPDSGDYKDHHLADWTRKSKERERKRTNQLTTCTHKGPNTTNHLYRQRDIMCLVCYKKHWVATTDPREKVSTDLWEASLRKNAANMGWDFVVPAHNTWSTADFSLKSRYGDAAHLMCFQCSSSVIQISSGYVRSTHNTQQLEDNGVLADLLLITEKCDICLQGG